ncbi:conserved hypothetical protein [uncultured Sporomusa sp.]|jgi:hypothetical protein|uniref:Uncharacterized protein n=1 Tax=uncultured Sporomusa sp. TaxID=307249 RepID=A0A212LZL0_9FIRM|nr:hypothetical protein [uncultured Sporomusa sp.]SCM83024.1 conserved hypothetical protein [uncultured Sporomusa sp.]
MIDLEAPIVPWEGIGNIKLYSTIDELKKIVEDKDTRRFEYYENLVRYEVPGKIYLFFNLINRKLFKITALEKYQGALFEQIKMGMHIREVLQIEPSFQYDEFEEVYCSPKGIYIETDAEHNTVQWISVFVKELEQEDFEGGNW